MIQPSYLIFLSKCRNLLISFPFLCAGSAFKAPIYFPHFFVLVQRSKSYNPNTCQGAIKRKFYCQESSRKKKGILSRLILPTKQVAPTLTMHLRLPTNRNTACLFLELRSGCARTCWKSCLNKLICSDSEPGEQGLGQILKVINLTLLTYSAKLKLYIIL